MTVFESVKEAIANNLDNVDIEKVTLESEIGKDLGADSLDAVEIIMELEERFNISIPNEGLVDIKTVGDLVTYIEQKSKK